MGFSDFSAFPAGTAQQLRDVLISAATARVLDEFAGTVCRLLSTELLAGSSTDAAAVSSTYRVGLDAAKALLGAALAELKTLRRMQHAVK
jgi:hypothetical protein